MYVTPVSSVSGAIHFVAKRPKISAFVATVTIAAALTLHSAPVPPPPHVDLIPSAPTVALIPEAPATQQPCSVEVPEPGAKPRQIGNCYFRFSAPPHGKDGLGARVDNVCKHKLDDTVLYLKSNQDAIVLEGNSLTGHGSIAISRARNVRAYLIRNGIDPNRISIKRGVKHSRVVDLVVDGQGK